MRVNLVTSVAAVTTAPSAAGAGSPAAARRDDDVFAAMLGDALQAPDDDSDAAAAATDVAAPAPDATTLFLQELPAAEAPAPPADDTIATAPDLPSTDPANICDTPVPRADEPPHVPADPAKDSAPPPNDSTLAQLLAAQQAMPAPIPTTPAPDTTKDSTAAKDAPPASAGADAAAGDPSVAQLLAAQQAAAMQAAPAADTAPGAPANAAIDNPATDVAATAILTGGAPVKPGKDDRPPADSGKTQKQSSTASALADLGKTRAFTDQKVSSAHALPIHPASETPRNNSQPAGQQTPGNPANAAPTPAADAPANFTPAPAEAARPPEAPASASIGAPPPPAPVAAATPQAASQLQIGHPAERPDINTLAFNIAAKSEGGARHFDIRLDPAELGRVDVRLTVDDAGKAQATLSVEKPQTLELLQKDQVHLERALKEAGLDMSQNGLNFSLKGQQQQGGGNAPSPRGRQLAVRAIAAAGEIASNLSLGGVATSDTRLDIRV
ncbi:MAG: flagellar hook-length control protein FliK [Rhizomicrobium sp.]